jgi:hypothetical protein
MKTSPYGFDPGRALRLAISPNIRLDTLGRVAKPDDSVFDETGLLHIKSAVSPELCDRAVADYDAFEKIRDETGCLVRGANGRNLRLANFHLESQAALAIGLNDAFHAPLTRFFRRPSSIYTSLTYKHGSQQTAHIDTPFFWTRPFNLYAGVWVALEDVQPEAGPLFYYPGSHKRYATEADLFAAFEGCDRSVDLMFDQMRGEAEKVARPELALIKKGDAVIWHPGILHGGTMATDPHATRYSIVFHFAPVGVNVRDTRFPNDFPNVPTYGIQRKNGNYYCRGKRAFTMV